MQSVESKIDARWFQISFQAAFMAYIILFLHAGSYWLHYFIYIGTALLLQLILSYFTNKNYSSWKSALISSLSLCLLLKTNYWYICALASALTIASKYLFRYKQEHIFNPSAFGIVVAILITDQAWLSPAQWGSGVTIFFMAVTLGTIVITRVQRLDISLAFLGTYIGLLFIRQILYLQWPLDYFIQSISTGSLLLFSFFMISDPKTTPHHRMARILWGVLIAAIAFYLSAFKFMYNTPIVVLIALAPLVPLLNKFIKATSFSWKTTSHLSSSFNKTKFLKQ